MAWLQKERNCPKQVVLHFRVGDSDCRRKERLTNCRLHHISKTPLVHQSGANLPVLLRLKSRNLVVPPPLDSQILIMFVCKNRHKDPQSKHVRTKTQKKHMVLQQFFRIPHLTSTSSACSRSLRPPSLHPARRFGHVPPVPPRKRSSSAPVHQARSTSAGESPGIKCFHRKEPPYFNKKSVLHCHGTGVRALDFQAPLI